MKELEQIRLELDEVDREIVRLFEARMKLAQEVAAYKIAHRLPVLDAGREEMVMASRVSMLQDGHWASGVRSLYGEIMRLSREEQQRLLQEAKEAENHA